jgi:hypothetical protein
VASRDRFGIQPRWPDKWMLEDGACVRVNGKSARLPSITSIVKANAMRVLRGKTLVAPTKYEPGRMWYAKRSGLPKHVEPALLLTMLRHARQRTHVALV